MAKERQKDAMSEASCGGEEATMSSGGEEANTRTSSDREAAATSALSDGEATAIGALNDGVETTIERLRVLQQAQELLLDAEKAEFDSMVKAGARGPHGIEDELDLFFEGLQPVWQNLKELQDEEVCRLDVGKLNYQS